MTFLRCVYDPDDFSLERLDELYARRARIAVAAEGLTGNYTFWRHDVDCSIQAAVRMAKWEQERGVRAVYYLMDGGNPFYGPSLAKQAAIQIAGLGHAVGWHVDPRLHSIDEIVRTVDALSVGRGWRSTPVSLHCPREEDLWKTYPFLCAYSPAWEGKYYSDSRGRFCYGTPELDDRRSLQINLHPEWWFEPDWYRRVDPAVYEGFFYEPIGMLAARS